MSLLLCSCSKSFVKTTPDFRTEVLTQLHQMGSDTSKPHSFDFYLYLPTEVTAKQAGQRLSAINYHVKVEPAAKGTDWLCLATTTLTPDTAPLSEIGNQFTQLAKEFHGDFDGWESDVINK